MEEVKDALVSFKNVYGGVITQKWYRDVTFEDYESGAFQDRIDADVEEVAALSGEPLQYSVHAKACIVEFISRD